MGQNIIHFLARYLSVTRLIHLLEAARDGQVREVNPAMAASLGLPQAELVARSAWDLLTEPDARTVRGLVERGASNDQPLLLNFVSASQSPFTLHCWCDAQPDGFLILGEPPGESAGVFQEEWLRMNNQLSVLARENARQSKELQKTLQELRDTHWHLKKLQEVLPICMECGKVKAGAQWQDVAQYLKKNALFLSHGYCPDCLVQVAAQWGLPLEGNRS